MKTSTTPLSARTDLRQALATLDQTRTRLSPLAELRAWRANAARRYVRPVRSELPPSR